MPKITIAAPGLEPNPMVVMQLLRAIGTKVRLIAEALSKQAPLLESDWPERPTAEQVERLRKLMAVLEQAAVRPLIRLDGREMQPRLLYEELEAAERMLMKAPTPGDGP